MCKLSERNEHSTIANQIATLPSLKKTPPTYNFIRIQIQIAIATDPDTGSETLDEFSLQIVRFRMRLLKFTFDIGHDNCRHIIKITCKAHLHRGKKKKIRVMLKCNSKPSSYRSKGECDNEESVNPIFAELIQYYETE